MPTFTSLIRIISFTILCDEAKFLFFFLQIEVVVDALSFVEVFVL